MNGGEGAAEAGIQPEAAALEAARYEVKKVVVGQDHALERLLVCLLAGGHCLLEGVPGLAKTLTVQTLATVMGGDFARIQFTPDLVPSDIVGTRVYRASTEHFDVELGPIFANFVLADEINRAPAKVQSALLEVMAEGHVTLAGQTFPAPRPFLVLATQNPIESEGVYPLPEAQQDRFLMKLLIDYPSYGEELEIVRRMSGGVAQVQPLLTPGELVRLQNAAGTIYVDPAVADYAVRLVLATRRPEAFGVEGVEPYIAYGASPRASLGLVVAARALALSSGRAFALPEDVAALAPDVLRHRLVLSYEALAEGLGADELIARVLAQVPQETARPAERAMGRGR
ncbi:MAG TPA: MoxR family ATPase [Acidimicrobiia bacterium]|nr:MoxR family ATPase [Acidimicrobiia bacterium]